MIFQCLWRVHWLVSFGHISLEVFVSKNDRDICHCFFEAKTVTVTGVAMGGVIFLWGKSEKLRHILRGANLMPENKTRAQPVTILPCFSQNKCFFRRKKCIFGNILRLLHMRRSLFFSEKSTTKKWVSSANALRRSQKCKCIEFSLIQRFTENQIIRSQFSETGVGVAMKKKSLPHIFQNCDKTSNSPIELVSYSRIILTKDSDLPKIF